MIQKNAGIVILILSTLSDLWIGKILHSYFELLSPDVKNGTMLCHANLFKVKVQTMFVIYIDLFDTTLLLFQEQHAHGIKKMFM